MMLPGYGDMPSRWNTWRYTLEMEYVAICPRDGIRGDMLSTWNTQRYTLDMEYMPRVQ